MTNMIEEEKKIGDEEKQQQQQHIESHAHHSGVLRSILERAVANRFSSKPIDVEKNRLALGGQPQRQHVIAQSNKQERQEMSILAAVEEDAKVNNSIRDVASLSDDSSSRYPSRNNHHSSQYHQQHCPTLTPSEQKYLEGLLESEDPDSIRQATLTLSDYSLFPREEEASMEELTEDEETTMKRRDSKVQRLFFRMHEMGRTPTMNNRSTAAAFASSPIRAGSNDSNNPRRNPLARNERKNSILLLESQTSMGSLLDDWRNSSIVLNYGPSAAVAGGLAGDGIEEDDNDDILAEDEDEYPQLKADRSASSTTSQDISSWLDGAPPNGVGKEGQHGVEVDNDNGIMNSTKIEDEPEPLFRTSFAILGTSAEDASCHPHVLSPPLMESLLEFVPETLTDYHFWIKYSLVRDGASLYTLLRHVRASTRTILAIETTDGQVFGAFTSQSWRLVQDLPVNSDGDDNDVPPKEAAIAATVSKEASFYGSQDSFLWKMRQSRFESQALVRSATVEQAILMESELAVYPFTGNNNFVQHCSPVDGIGLGDEASAIRLDPSLRSGSTAASETFGNPCLLDPKESASKTFQVANLEVWTLTPHDTVKDAEQAELKAFFQQRQREEHKNRLDLLGILVGGPKTRK